MAEHDKTPVVFGARIARDENDRKIGYQAYRGERGKHKGDAIVTVAGPIRDGYPEASQDARAAHDAEFGRSRFADFDPVRV